MNTRLGKDQVLPSEQTRGVEDRAVGLRVKLGWALGVVVTDAGGAPAVVARVDLRFTADDGVYAYHQAMDVEPGRRAAVVATASARAADAAAERLAEVADEHGITCVGVVVGRGVRRIPLERIMASSQLFHTAEAEVLQEGLVAACARLLLPCEHMTFAAAEADEGWGVVSGLAKTAGRPWRKDEKLATTAGWHALRRLAR